MDQGLQEDLGVALSMKALAESGELRAQLQVVVDFAVEDQNKPAIVTEHRLICGVRQIQNLESAQPDCRTNARQQSAPHACIVWSAVILNLKHALQGF